MTVFSEFIKNNSGKDACINCVLLISIYATNSSEKSNVIMYDIEVSQGVTKLTDHEQHHDFLEEDSAKYYKY